ncbi:hypothetical protein RND81_07G074400 [Saponaria officinalis]|uniref:Uncharacterized protein n=1 Tax=Saponaria officinalis TaxID=3572 RepID=A0AAW1JPB3_SAPOF
MSIIYAFNGAVKRRELWDNLATTSRFIIGPWVWCGDFNCVLASDERIGQLVQLVEIHDFADCVHTCGMFDIKATGSFFTWIIKQMGEHRVYCRLDRVMHNGEWGICFDDAAAEFLPEGLYDHCPCLISLLGNMVKRKQSFKYYNMWSLAPDFGDLLMKGWDKDIVGTPMFQLVQKLRGLKGVFKDLNRGSFSNVEQNAQVALKCLLDCQQRLQVTPADRMLMEEERAAANAYTMLHNAQLKFLKQKAKVQWYDKGDDNIAFFHTFIKARRRHNCVLEIMDIHGNICSAPDLIYDAFEEYYLGLLGTCKSVESVHVATIQMGPLVFSDHSSSLLFPVTGEKIRKAMFAIEGTKASSLDGFSSQFFKDGWGVVGPFVIQAVRDFF